MTQPPEDPASGIPAAESSPAAQRDAYCMMCGAALAGAAPAGAPRGLCGDCAARHAGGQRLCPFCRETVLATVQRCPFCDEILDGAERRRAFARYNVPAVISLVLGILGCLYCLPGIAAIVLGSVASRQIERSNGEMKGDALARWGIILGIFWIVVFVLLFIGIALSSSH